MPRRTDVHRVLIVGSGPIIIRQVPIMNGADIMPRRADIHRILIVGSGPIIIGQAPIANGAATVRERT